MIKQTKIEITSAIIKYFGTGQTYCHISQVTANILAKAINFVKVDIITQIQTSFTASEIIFITSFQESLSSSRCLEIFSTITIELSTTIQTTKISAKSVILLILSHKTSAVRKVRSKTSGIAIAEFNQSFNHKNNHKISVTIKNHSIKFSISLFVASFAVFHSF